MPSSSYDNLPSSAVESVDIDFGTDVVTVVYKSNPTKKYYYEVADGAEFDRQFLAEFDKEDFSVGAYLNEKKSTNVMREHPDPAQYEANLREGIGQPILVNGVSRQLDPRRMAARDGASAPSMFDVNASKFAKEKPEVGGPPREPETR